MTEDQIHSRADDRELDRLYGADPAPEPDADVVRDELMQDVWDEQSDGEGGK